MTPYDGTVATAAPDIDSSLSREIIIAIIDYLAQLHKDFPDETENLEIARESLAAACKVDLSDAKHIRAVANKVCLAEACKRHLQRGASQNGAGTTSTGTSSDGAAPGPEASRADGDGEEAEGEAAPAAVAVTQEQKDEAVRLKEAGNKAFNERRFEAAIGLFTQAMELDPADAIYPCNISAAHASCGRYEQARAFAAASTARDPQYAKAWYRLGSACYHLKAFRESEEAYQAGLDVKDVPCKISQELAAGLCSARKALLSPPKSKEPSPQRTTAGADAAPNFQDMFNTMMANPKALQDAMNMLNINPNDPKLNPNNLAKLARDLPRQ